MKYSIPDKIKAYVDENMYEQPMSKEECLKHVELLGKELSSDTGAGIELDMVFNTATKDFELNEIQIDGEKVAKMCVDLFEDEFSGSTVSTATAELFENKIGQMLFEKTGIPVSIVLCKVTMDLIDVCIDIPEEKAVQ